MKTVRKKLVRHSLVYLSMQKWFVGDVHYYAKIWQKLTHPLKTPISSNVCS